MTPETHLKSLAHSPSQKTYFFAGVCSGFSVRLQMSVHPINPNNTGISRGSRQRLLSVASHASQHPVCSSLLGLRSRHQAEAAVCSRVPRSSFVRCLYTPRLRLPPRPRAADGLRRFCPGPRPSPRQRAPGGPQQPQQLSHTLAENACSFPCARRCVRVQSCRYKSAAAGVPLRVLW